MRSCCVCESEFQITLMQSSKNTYLITYMFILFLMQRGTTPSEAPDKANNQPHIVCFQDEEEDLLGQYFKAVEQVLMMESSSLIAALFFCSVHIIFLMYSTTPKQLK